MWSNRTTLLDKMVKKLTDTKKEMFYGSCIDNSHTGHIDSHRVGGGGGGGDERWIREISVPKNTSSIATFHSSRVIKTS